ncbi:MAG: hypothetical protein RL240_2010 [Planctomycetota bacterium]|jgi:hypothetical protein
MFGLAIGFIALVAAVSRGSELNSDLKSFAHWFLSANPFWFWPVYFLALALVFLVLYAVYRRGPKPIREPLKIPHTIDPYSIAYLRGGDAEVISTAMVELVASGKIVEYVPHHKPSQRSIFNKIIESPINNSNRSKRSTDHWIANCDDASSDSTPKIHQIILKHFFAPKGASSVFCEDVYSAVGFLNEPYKEWIKTEGLSNAQFRNFDLFLRLAYGSFLSFEALGISKAQNDFPLGTGKPEWHMTFTVIVMLIPTVFIFLVTSMPRSTRGQQYLKDIERAFASLRNDPNTSVGTLAGLFGPSAVTLDSVKRIVAQWESDANADGSPAAG